MQIIAPRHTGLQINVAIFLLEYMTVFKLVKEKIFLHT